MMKTKPSKKGKKKFKQKTSKLIFNSFWPTLTTSNWFTHIPNLRVKSIALTNWRISSNE